MFCFLCLSTDSPCALSSLTIGLLNGTLTNSSPESVGIQLLSISINCWFCSASLCLTEPVCVAVLQFWYVQHRSSHSPSFVYAQFIHSVCLNRARGGDLLQVQVCILDDSHILCSSVCEDGKQWPCCWSQFCCSLLKGLLTFGEFAASLYHYSSNISNSGSWQYRIDWVKLSQASLI